MLGDSSVCRVAASKTPTPRLFRNLQSGVKLVATKSCRFNADAAICSRTVSLYHLPRLGELRYSLMMAATKSV